MAHIREYSVKNDTEKRYMAVVEVGNSKKRKRKHKSFRRKGDAKNWIHKKLHEKNNNISIFEL